MKRNNYRITYTAARGIAAGMLVAIFAFASGSVLGAPASGESRVEAHIKNMHAKLKIMAAQEDQWKQVAQVMRDNENRVEPLIKDRAKKAKTMTAVDDLKSYAEISEAHAEGIKKFIPVFETLYVSMSDAQKKEADALFRHGARKMKKAK
jgi:periplasmic protein CpxP/Spy